MFLYATPPGSLLEILELWQLLEISLHPFVDVPPGKLSVPAEFAVLRNAFIRYHEAKRSGQEVPGLYGLEWDHLREGIVSQPSHVVWATTDIPRSITSNIACPEHLIVQQFRNQEAYMVRRDGCDTSISMPGSWRDTGHKALCPVSSKQCRGIQIS